MKDKVKEFRKKVQTWANNCAAYEKQPIDIYGEQYHRGAKEAFQRVVDEWPEGLSLPDREPRCEVCQSLGHATREHGDARGYSHSVIPAAQSAQPPPAGAGEPPLKHFSVTMGMIRFELYGVPMNVEASADRVKDGPARIGAFHKLIAELAALRSVSPVAPRCEFKFRGKRCVLDAGHADDGPNKTNHQTG